MGVLALMHFGETPDIGAKSPVCECVELMNLNPTHGFVRSTNVIYIFYFLQ